MPVLLPGCWRRRARAGPLFDVVVSVACRNQQAAFVTSLHLLVAGACVLAARMIETMLMHRRAESP